MRARPWLAAMIAWLAAVEACSGHEADPHAAGPDAGPPSQASSQPEPPAATGDDALPVYTEHGPVQGVVAGAARVFRGVPYARAPVGELRFAPPQAPAAWSEPPRAEPTVCPQLGADGALLGSEDCLTLDLWAPLVPSTRPLPVMVWIHGGGFTAGSGFLADTLLPARSVIVVAINYRLGALGFLSHPALGADSGNAAILDQRFALQWVQANIAAFGGDPERVTIFGESAGGSAVCAQLWSPLSDGLFSGAIIQSGALCGRQSRTLAEGEAQGLALAAAVGCGGEGDPLACLRAQPIEKLLGALPLRTLLADGASWGPVVDGRVFVHDLPVALASGAFAHVPTIVGSNAHEGLAFLFGLEALSAEDYAARVRASPFFGEHAAELLAAYPASDYETPQLALAALVGERVFNCPARRTARALAAAGVPSWLYFFDYGFSLHAGELQFLFGGALTEADKRVAALMNDVWASFATTGEPSTAAAQWPRYAAASDQHLVIADPPTVADHLLEQHCDVWDEFEP